MALPVRREDEEEGIDAVDILQWRSQRLWTDEVWLQIFIRKGEVRF